MISKSTSPAPSDILKGRGLESAAREAGWREEASRRAWLYPVHSLAGALVADASGRAILRAKAFDSGAKPKYWWLPQKPADIRWYLLEDTLAAIQAAEGRCYLASGEPDHLTYRAAGIKNVVSWFDGELSIPPTLIADLRFLGIRSLIDFPDCDATGLRKAARLTRLLNGEIGYRAFRLGREVGTKFDINALWQAIRFDRAAFKAALEAAPPYDQATLDLYSGQSAFPTLSASAAPGGGAEFPPAFVEAVLKAIECLEGFKGWRGDEALIRCLNPAHEDRHPSASFNRAKLAYHCFGCGLSAGVVEVGKYLGLDIADYRAPPKIPPFKSPLSHFAVPSDIPSTSPTPTSAGRLSASLGAFLAHSDDSLDAIEALLDGSSVPAYEPLDFPFRSLHRFGGFAETMTPGKLIYVMGVPGGGKTQFGESVTDRLLIEGHDVIWFNPEWSPDEMQRRRIQRYGGPSLVEIARFERWQIDAAKGIDPAKRRGADLTPDQRAVARRILETVRGWQGKAYQLRHAKELNTLPKILEALEALIAHQRASGRKISTLFWDYIQRSPRLAENSRDGWDRFEEIAHQIKAFCERLELFGWIFIQPKKDDSRQARGGDPLEASSAQGLSEQQANLFLTLTPAWDEDGHKLPYITLRIVKNSLGQEGKIALKWAQRYLTIVDEEYPHAPK